MDREEVRNVIERLNELQEEADAKRKEHEGPHAEPTRKCMYYLGKDVGLARAQQVLRARVGDLSEDEEKMLYLIKHGDADSTNGGVYIEPDERDTAERLVDKGQVVRMENPAGRTPVYVPMDSEHYSDNRLNRMRERQSSDTP